MAYTTNKTADQGGARLALRYAALELARQAWNAGQNINDALTVGGYALEVRNWVIDQFQGGQEPPLTQSSESHEEEMSTVKRARTGPRTEVGVSKNVRKAMKKCIEREKEVKFTYLAAALNPVPAAGSIVCNPLVIVQGTSDGTRVGNEIKVKYVKLKAYVTSTTPDVVRLIVCWDRQPNFTAPVSADLLTVAGVNGPYNFNTVVGAGGNRFTILMDQKYTINPTIAATARTVEINKSWTKKSIQRRVTYGANGGTVADLATNNLVVFAWSVAGAPIMAGYFTVAYTDA